MSMDSTKLGQEAEEAPAASQVTQASWLKRLSTFSSDQGSLPSSPRPPSTAVSQSNGSVAFSNAGSTTPMFPSFAPQPVPPNKLVKRSSSIRSTKASSRIPIPNFKRPATSHERDATLQELHRRPSTTASSVMRMESPQPEPTEVSWKSYFTPKVTIASLQTTSRRNSTSIPNPIKRITPDRKYHPVLISGHEIIKPASVDIEQNESQDSLPVFSKTRGSMRASKRFFSAPLPQRPSTASSNASFSPAHLRPDDARTASSAGDASKRSSQLSQGQSEPARSSPLLSVNRRSFSPAGLIPTELPKWKRPSKRNADPKSRRKGNRSASGPDAAMINAPPAAVETERPAKRRDISGLSRRSSVQSRDGPINSPKLPLHETQANRSASGQTKTLQAFANEDISYQRNSWAENSLPQQVYQASSPQQVYQVSSPAAGSTKSRPSRQSAAMSEFASTFAGSDSDARYPDDDGFESPNDTLFDSVRTRATSASSTGFKGPRIETIFDESRAIPEGSPSSTDHLFQQSKFSSGFDRPRHSVIEEEESVSTPVRSHHNGSIKQSPETFRLGSSPPHLLNSSPPEVPSIFRRHPSGEVGLGLEEDGMWDFGDDEGLPTWPLNGNQPTNGSAFSGPMLHPNLKTTGLQLASVNNFSEPLNDARSNIFDWSEQHLNEKSPAGRSPPRPRTVHGKKDAENRGSRSVGRRAPSALHIRSQSVPVAPEVDGKRSQVVTNKFGTWGVGSKGVTEDWNEDFDFEEEPVPPVPAVYEKEIKQREVSSSSGMHVPKAIQQQQQNVLANINLLRDWGLLIEELKELRGKAINLGLIDDFKDATWHEVDAMIDLADQESNDHTLAPRQSPPSSPTFDYSAFDEPAPSMPIRSSPRPPPKMHAEAIFESPTPSPVRKPLDQPDLPSPRRPRKDSEAVARSVIEALQQRRNISDPTGNSTAANKKVPFDTATLKRIVPYVQEMRDKVKRSIRDAEDLYNSPRLMEDAVDPSFSRMFHDPPESPTMHRSRKRSNNEHISPDSNASRSPHDELSRRMELMTMG
ncbi:hypothetical protein BDZ85DRAFT_282127 [Elsinoe ampelina]|uniref:Uncharacterized protein n=1 Tax=Elsinoe ampelina TaxID=302913 RepID=A0A6A6GCJ2_9PEZI|nr:hypothetical protein BDZ85DRAFT_282127 [Elsinoe ampelina]